MLLRILKKKPFKKGFTLMELLVVISIIGIMATFIIPRLTGAKKKGEVSHFVTQIREVERALYFTYLDENRSTWWTEGEIGTFNPTLSYLIGINSGPLATFSEWYKNSPPNYLVNAEYRFDNDGDTYGECGTAGAIFSGVNMLVYGIPFEDIEEVNAYLDGGDEVDPNICGKIRYRVSAVTGQPLLIYRIDLDTEVE